jgi:hypothetical protein
VTWPAKRPSRWKLTPADAPVKPWLANQSRVNRPLAGS